MMKCDVLIVGAGCSGCIAALKSAYEGLSAILIDTATLSNKTTKLDFTENKGLEKIIGELRLPIKQRVSKAVWSSKNKAIEFESKVGDLYVKRGYAEDCFERIIIEKFLSMGGALFENIKIDGVTTTGNVVKNVNVSINNRSERIEPKTIIVANGHNNEFGEGIGLKTRVLHKFIGYGIYGNDFDIEVGKTYISFDSETTPGGYTYMGKTNDGNSVLCSVLNPELALHKKNTQFYERFWFDKLSKQVHMDKEDLLFFSGVGIVREVKSVPFVNSLFVGEAGGFLDPLFGYGVRNSIITGYLAAKAAKYASSSENSSPLENFKTEADILKNNFRLNLRLRKILDKFDNDDNDALFSLFQSYLKGGGDMDKIIDGELDLTLISRLLMDPKALMHFLYKFSLF